MKTTTIKFHHGPSLKGLLEITSDDEIYTWDTVTNLRGFQCEFAGDTPEYKEKMKLFDSLAESFYKIIKFKMNNTE